MAGLRVALSRAQAAANRPRHAARLVTPQDGTIELPWWPDEVAWSRLSPTWTELPRPGKDPLLVVEGNQLPTLTVGFIASALGSDRADYDSGAAGVITPLRRAAADGDSVYLVLGTEHTTVPWVISELGYTELEWTSEGKVSRAEVSMTLTRVSDATTPRGPVKPKKPGKKKK